MNDILQYLIPFACALIVTCALLPMWISVCKKWKLFDFPDTRKLHSPCIPTMGGLAIFGGVFMSFLLFANMDHNGHLRYLICATILLFFTGFFDDLLDIHATRKLIIQVVAALIVVVGGNRITSFYGIGGLNEIPVWAQYPVTMFFIIAVTNAYNFVDGIDGLASSLGIIGSAAFGVIFMLNGQSDFAILSFCLAGSLVGFLFFNFHPAKIFMGDTGSLLIGFVVSTLAVNILSIPEAAFAGLAIRPAFIAAVLFIPVYDILRVFVIRLLNGDSPLKADRNHLHHMIIKQGFTHKGAAIILSVFNMLVIGLQLIFSDIDINQFIILSICSALLTLNTFSIHGAVWLFRKVFGIDPRTSPGI